MRLTVIRLPPAATQLLQGSIINSFNAGRNATGKSSARADRGAGWIGKSSGERIRAPTR